VKLSQRLPPLLVTPIARTATRSPRPKMISTAGAYEAIESYT